MQDGQICDPLEKLGRGDLRSIGRANEVACDVIACPSLFARVFSGMLHHDPVVRMRAADAAEKISRLHPQYLQPHKELLIREVSRVEQQEVRWHVALMFSYLDLDDEERVLVASKLFSWMDDSGSRIVQVNSMHALARIARDEAGLVPRSITHLEGAVDRGSPAVRNRARKLLLELGHTPTV